MSSTVKPCAAKVNDERLQHAIEFHNSWSETIDVDSKVALREMHRVVNQAESVFLEPALH